MQTETTINFPGLTRAGVHFTETHVFSEPREEVELSRADFRELCQKALWHVFACSEESAEGKVDGEARAVDAGFEVRVGDFASQLLYDRERDTVTMAARDAYSVTRVEFAWLTRVQLEWVENLRSATGG